MRAASSAWIVGGISSAARFAPTVQRSPSLRERALLHQHAHQLADEERVALAGGEHLGRDRGGQVGGADHVGGEPHRRAGIETARASRRRRRARPASPATSAASRSSGRAPTSTSSGTPLPHCTRCSTRSSSSGSAQCRSSITSTTGFVCGERGEQAADDEEGLLGRGRRAGEQRGDAAGDARALGVVAGQRGLDRGAQRLGARAVLDARGARAAPRRAARRWRRRRRRSARATTVARVAEPARELVDQARLAEPRRAEQHGEARPRASRPPRRTPRSRRASSSSRPTNARRRRARGPLERHDAIRLHRLGAALQREAAERLERHERRDEALRRLADHDVAVARLAPAGAPRRSPDRR